MTLSPHLAADHHSDAVGQNWAKSISYGAARFHRPASVNELREIVRRSSRVKALGGRHSFSRIADTDADWVGTERGAVRNGLSNAARLAVGHCLSAKSV